MDEVGSSIPAGAEAFIEGVGRYFEELGVPRIGGRILGLLMVAERPLTLDEIARTLQISRASVSTNARLVIAANLVERTGRTGDRRDYYVFGRRAWAGALEADINVMRTLERLTEEGAASLDPANAIGHARLREAAAFARFCAAELGGMAERWRQQSESRPTSIQPASHT